jgi:hypothetical protein
MTKPPTPLRDPSPKLPQARLYLEIAQWGFDQLLEKKHMGRAYRFYVVGVLASLRAVQHALKNSDAKISDAHRAVIDQWWDDPAAKNAPELKFIKTSRDLLLKEGSFESYATHTESGTGEGSNYTVVREDCDLAYYIDGVRHDLLADTKRALAWCERELTSIEAKLP